MKCAICDTDSDSVSLVDDCSECQQAIFECLAGYPPLEGNDDYQTVDPDFEG